MTGYRHKMTGYRHKRPANLRPEQCPRERQ
jgi:hypothetical protein